MSDTTQEMSAEAKAELARKMDTPIGNMPITMNTLNSIANLPAIPDHYKGKPKEMLAAALMGREIGIGPMTSINNIDLIDGNVSMRAKLMSALIHRAGHVIVVEEQTPEVARLKCLRYHRPTGTLIDAGIIEYTKEDAETAGAMKRGTYKQHPKAMLTNRALTLAARTIYADVLAGFAYTAEEVEMSDEVEPIPMELEVSEMQAAEAAATVILDAEVVAESGEQE